MVLLVWLTTLLICWTLRADNVPRDFKELEIESVMDVLLSEASKDKYIYYELENDWGIINDKFFNDINIKINQCSFNKDLCKAGFFEDKLVVMLAFAIGMIVGGVAL